MHAVESKKPSHMIKIPFASLCLSQCDYFTQYKNIYYFLRLLSHSKKKNTPKMQISQLINNKKLEKGGEKLDVEITERASIDRAPHAEIHPPECSIQLRSRQSFKRSQHLHKRLVSTPCFVLYPSFLNLNPTNQLYNWF